MIYLDHHATTPVDARVLEVMLPYFTERFGNAASKQHAFGWAANDAVERARKQVAALVGAGSKDVVFTSGATEANNLAIKGAAEARRGERDHLVTIVTEHQAVLDPMRRLERDGWRLTVLPVGGSGLVDLSELERAITARTALVSVMAANNEIGVLQPIREAAALAHAQGAWFHTDAVQAVGKVPFDVEALDVDLASLTAHKLYGPKGAGALYVRRPSTLLGAGNRGVKLAAQVDGGGHERGMRSGTLNVPGIVGFGQAADLARVEMASEAGRMTGLRDRLLAGLRAKTDGMSVNGAMDARLPGNLNVSFDDVDAEAIMLACREIAVSSGSACTSASLEPSHVLKAIGLSSVRAHGSIRFGLGRRTTADEIERTITAFATAIPTLRAMNP